MKYKVGDKVIVRDDLVVGNHYWGLLFNIHMKKFLGKTFTIERVERNDKYRLKGIEQFTFNSSMLEPDEGFTFEEVIGTIKNGEDYVSTTDLWRLKKISKSNGGIVLYYTQRVEKHGMNVLGFTTRQKFKLLPPTTKYITNIYSVEHGPKKYKI